MDNSDVLHIYRDISNRPLKRQLWGELRRLFFFYDQEGYFGASFYEAFESITSMGAARALSRLDRLEGEYDVVVVNTKSIHSYDDSKQHKLQKLSKAGDVSVLVETSANANHMPADDTCSEYDLVFRREVFKDRDRYDLSAENKEKLRTTMLPCLQVPLPRNAFATVLKPIFIPQAPKLNNPDKKHDVFFCGNVASSKTGRIEAVKSLNEDPEIDFHGGLQPKNDEVDLPETLRFPRMSSGEYARAFQRSKIVLALDGIGQFTFRHLEAWYFGCFMISSPSIRDVEIPLPAEEGKHYIAYDDTDDLKKKVTYYTENKKEREQIAETGRKMFLQEYDPEKHGSYIRSSIRNVL
jgi:hypothetical protein